MKIPIKFETKHRANFSQLDPYGHVNAEHYVSFFINHRFEGMRNALGWSFASILELPIAFYITRTEIDYILPIIGDKEFTISSQVVIFRRFDCTVECELRSGTGRLLAKCTMIIVSFDKKSTKPGPWPIMVIESFYRKEN